MSWWRRLLGKAPPEPEAPPPEPEELIAVEEETRPPDDPELRLEALGDDPGDDLDEATALELIERLRAQGREARAIDLARRILAHHPDARAVHQRVAEMLTSRGDDEGAGRLLTPFLDAPDAPLDLLMLGAEILERRGLSDVALGLYERIVAQDLDYPRARARVRRLRGGAAKADLGATLMADGALTRGRYRVERELGRGGAGTVFLAEDLQLERRVALKVYHRRGRAERARLLIEGRVPARFEHPGVVRVFDLEESLAAIVMERVGGGAVRGQIQRGPIPLARALRWFASAADALAHVHQRGFVHRDIKPSNMLLREDDRAVLTDFGLACPVGEEPERPGEGTRQYMPREQRHGDAAAPSMDVYALGVSLAEVMTHCPEATPPEVDALVARCRAEAPGDRPNASDVRRGLEAAALARSTGSE